MCASMQGNSSPPLSLFLALSNANGQVFMLALEYPLCISGTNTAAPVCRSTCTQFEELCGASGMCSRVALPTTVASGITIEHSPDRVSTCPSQA